jgi:hypothetical protein
MLPPRKITRHPSLKGLEHLLPNISSHQMFREAIQRTTLALLQLLDMPPKILHQNRVHLQMTNEVVGKGVRLGLVQEHLYLRNGIAAILRLRADPPGAIQMRN